jgi:glycosyltransferase involved in cell wall biosynthesis
VYGHEPSHDVRRTLPIDRINFHPPVSTEESAEIQVRADLLFLPLSFTCEYPALIRTSAPGKFGEYLASGTPVLVHAPADSFPVRFVTQHGCAAACAVPDKHALAVTLAAMIRDAESRETMTRRAIAMADDFSMAVNCRRLTECLKAPAVRAA